MVHYGIQLTQTVCLCLQIQQFMSIISIGYSLRSADEMKTAMQTDIAYNIVVIMTCTCMIYRDTFFSIAKPYLHLMLLIVCSISLLLQIAEL